MTEITGVRADIITALIGDGEPASDALIKSLADSVRDRREHEHDRWDDVFCSDKVAWAGERVAPVLRRLVTAEAKVARLHTELAKTATDLTVYQLRAGTADDDALRLGLYANQAAAKAHGIAAYQHRFGAIDALSWAQWDEDEPGVIRLHATDDSSAPTPTDWHIVPLVAAAEYDPNAED